MWDWNKITSLSWILYVTAIDFMVSMGLARLVVQYAGWRYSFGLSTELDASNSILGYTALFGVILPIVILFGMAILFSLTNNDTAKIED